MDTATREPRVTTRRDLGRLVLVLVAFTLLLRLPAFFVDVFNSDETFLATQAQVIREGGNLYEEAADRKPPLVPYVYAASFAAFGTTALWSVRLVAMGAVVLTALMLALEARRRYGRRAAWAAGLLCVFGLVAFAPQDGQAANFEIFMLPAMTAAVLLARRGRAGAAGIAVAVATLAKQTGAATLLPVLYLVWRARGRAGASRAALGFGIPITLVALALGPGRLVHWTVLGNGSYVNYDSASTAVLTTFVLMSLAWGACNLPILWRLPVAWTERGLPARDGARDVDLWLWLASAAVSVMVGLRFFGHYFLQLIPPLCLLTVSTFSRRGEADTFGRGHETSARPAAVGEAAAADAVGADEQSARRGRAAVATLGLAAVMAVAFSAAGYFMHPFGPEPRYETVSEYLEAHTRPTDRIFVWGSVPEIYWASDRLPATRFVTTLTFLANNHPGRPPQDADPEDSQPSDWELFFDDLTAHPPRYILDTAPANIRGAAWTPIDRFPRLEALVDDQYRYVRSIDGIVIYERRR